MTSIKDHSGNKYIRKFFSCVNLNTWIKADVYAVIEAFKVLCPARQHAIKKLLCSGLRGKGSELQDLKEARDAIDRAIEMQVQREEAVEEEPAPVQNCIACVGCSKKSTYAYNRTRLKKDGWSKDPDIGWLCPGCADEDEDLDLS